MNDKEQLIEAIKALRARIAGSEKENRELREENQRYKQALEEILRLDMDISNIQYADAVLTIASKALEVRE